MKTNVLLMGPIGTGKTSALRTIPAGGHRLFAIAVEPGIEAILTHSDLCHWTYIPPATTDWDTLEKNAKLINTSTQDVLLKSQGNRREYTQFIQVLTACSNFRCDVCGQTFGPIDALPPDDFVAVDSLSGLGVTALDLVCGGKPIRSQADWGIAMENLEKLIMKLCADLKCSFVLTGHVDRELDEIQGGTKIMVSTLGRKLAPKIPRFFDEVVLTVRRGGEFYWSTIENGVDLKARRLPFSDEIRPTFEHFMETK